MAASDAPARPWVAYTLLRLVFFAVPLLLIWGFSGNIALSAVFAAVIGLCLSVVLLDRQRGALALRIERWSEKRRPASDEFAEDRAVDEDRPVEQDPAVDGDRPATTADGQAASAAASPKP